MRTASRICGLGAAALLGVNPAGASWGGGPVVVHLPEGLSQLARHLPEGSFQPPVHQPEGLSQPPVHPPEGLSHPKPADLKTPAKPQTPESPHFKLDPRHRGTYTAMFFGASQVRIPNRILSTFLRSYSNALCRARPSARARAMGVNRSDACNFSLRAGLRRVKGRYGYDLELSYTRLAMPKSNWVAADEQIPAADYIELSFHAVALSAGIWRDIPLSRRPTRWTWRFGAQLGLALLAGSMHRTKLGAQPASCTFDTLGDPTLCRPYRPLEFNEAGRTTRAFAHCSREEGCDPRDLLRAGREQMDAIPPLVPWLNLWTGPGYAIDRNTRIDARVSLGMGLGIGVGLERRLSR